MRASDNAWRRAEARIRQYGCLGLGSELVMPDVLRELHRFIPSYSNTFYWTDGSGHVANVFDEQPDAIRVLPEYLECFYNKAETEVHPGFTRVVRELRGVLDNAGFFTVSNAQLRNSAFYARIMRPQKYFHVLQLYVRIAGRTHGILQLQRSAGERAFSDSERRRLGRLHGFIATALNAPSAAKPACEWIDGNDSGLLLTDADGHVVSASPRGAQLLFLSLNPVMRASSVSRQRLPPELIAICRQLRPVREQQAHARPPLHVCTNWWGRFIFSAHSLDTARNENGLIGIHVRREAPLLTSLIAATHRFELSKRQAQIAALLAGGLSHRAIAEHLGLKRNTVISHSRLIYARLDVHDAHSLREALLSSTGNPDVPTAANGMNALH